MAPRSPITSHATRAAIPIAIKLLLGVQAVKYEKPDVPQFICGNGETVVVFTSTERDGFIAQYRMEYAEKYCDKHGEFPEMDLQIKAIQRAERIYDSRVVVAEEVRHEARVAAEDVFNRRQAMRDSAK